MKVLWSVSLVFTLIAVFYFIGAMFFDTTGRDLNTVFMAVALVAGLPYILVKNITELLKK